jgi:PAS domain S-box-containing protein
MVDHFEKHKTELRQRAEARVHSFSAALAKTPQDIQGLVHELNVHQIELEMQYEELQRGQEQVEESRDRYADLYESAPVGYFTLLKDGTIVEVNHAGAALMGVAPFDLKERRFQLMVAMNDREAFTTFCQRVLDTQEPGSCEVRLELPKSGSGDDQRGPYLTVLIQAGPVRAGLGKGRHLRVAAMDITERKRVEEQLRRSETNLADGQRISRTGSWTWKASSEQLFCSKELLRIFGLEPGTKPSHEDFLRIIHPEDQARVRDSFNRALRAGTEYEAKYRIVLSDGSVRHIRNLGHPLLNQSGRLIEYVGTAIDTTERQRAEEALRASEERFRSYFEQGLIGMAMTSSTKGILEVNDELCRILGYSRSELLQKTWAEMTHPGDLAADVAQFNRIMAGEIDAYTMDKRWIRKDGRTIATIMTVKCVRRADGSVDYFVGLVLDITERKRAEEALRQSQSELALIERRSVVGEIATSIGHEVNQPLAAIMTNSQTCLRWLAGTKPDLGQVRETLEDIVHDANRASQVIARIKRLVTKTPSETMPLDLNEVIQEAVALVHHDMLTRIVSIRLDLSSALPSVLGDRIQVQQVLLNLILNAFDAMSEVEEHARELFIRTNRQNKEVMVVVRDTGAGLDPGKLDQIFAPFETTKPHGMGMGLTISRSIVEAHGGRLWAMLNDDRGATFTFTIPMV